MNLAHLMSGLVDAELLEQPPEINGLALDSRKILPGFAFIALAGSVEHGLNYVQQVVDKGAVAIIYEADGSEGFELETTDCFTLKVEKLTEKLGFIAERFYQSPSRAVELIGITGTNGKTSCSQFLIQLMPESAVIGTLGWGDVKSLNQTVNTTPDALSVHQILADFVAMKKQTVVMEVSSHGLEQGRVNALNFKAAVLTNLSRDHLDYHGTMEAYLKAKLALFNRVELEYVVINLDDPYASEFLATAPGHVKRWTYSAKGLSTDLAVSVTAENARFGLKGIEFVVNYAGKKIPAEIRLVGDFNLDNVLAVLTVLLAQSYSLEQAVSKLAELRPVAGRMEAYGGAGKPYVFVDYAHTPDALEKLLKSLTKYCNQKLRLVFGCGGNRDKGKRAEMARVAEKLADQIIITDDNPRLEKAEYIIQDILQGFSETQPQLIQNRRQAIQTVIRNANINDCVVIAGKGHENYQDINGIKYPFSDQKEVEQALSEWAEE